MPAANYSLIPRESSVNTTDATVTVLDSIPMGALTAPINVIKCLVTGRRTGGASGSDGDSAGYEISATFKRVGSTVSLVGSVVTTMASEDQVGWNCTLAANGQNVEVRVTGASGNNVTWTSFASVTRGI